MLPDTGERYMSTPLFEHIGEEMTSEELEISRSTPLCRFDAPARAKVAAAAPAAPVPTDAGAEQLVTELIRDEPVLIFALEWCEFCWSARKLFSRLDIAYRSIDLDSVAYQADDLGGKIRAVLANRTGSPTIPQIYIGGRHIGGSTDLFDAWRAGSIQRQLAETGVSYRTDIDIDPYSLLPKWLQPRKSA
jgi:cysteine synthase A